MARSKDEKVGLPEELIIDILYRLPPNSIGLFRCVSKKWNNFLSDPQFTKAHLTIHANKQEKIICISHSHSLHTITFNPQNGNDGFSRKLHFEQLSDNWLRIVGSCNGLVLVEDNENSQFLINPTTLKYHQIPNFHLALPFDDSFCISGLGYDFTSDDYKVVTLSQYFADYEMNIDITFVDVYSVRKGRWRRLEILPYTPFLASGVFVDGALHWLVWNNSRDSFLIVAFDLSNETFLEVPTPSTMDNTVMCYYLTAFRGCLCMCTNAGEDKTAVWMMKEYGVKESWTKFSVRGPTTVFDFVPLCLMSDDDVVLDVYNEKLTVYNMKEDQWRDMIVDGIIAKSLQAETFTESLVSPMFGKGIEGYFIA